MKLLNRQWQSVDGTRQVRIYPYLRRPDILSSNAYILDAPEQIVLIDTGALAEQTEELFATIRSLVRERPRPLLIYLTHCHIDHALNIGVYHALRRETPVWVAVGHDGADTLVSGDPQRTASDLFCIEFPAITPDILLLPPQARKQTYQRDILLSDRKSITITTDKIQTGVAVPFYRETLSLGGDDILEWYQTPGHSPESACLKVGRLLFIGDVLAAVNPFVAGISGWNQQAFIHSASHVIWLLENTDIAWCCPGHGNAITAPLVIDLLKKVRTQAEGLDNLEEENTSRLQRTTDYTLEILEEAEEVFAAMAGRLNLLAYHLENLDEEQLAQHYRQLLDADKIDECLHNLRILADDFRAGQRFKIDLVIRASAIFQKIETLYDQEKLRDIIPSSLGNRAKTLLLDFINTAKGLRNPEEFVATDLNNLVEEVLQDLLRSPHDDDSILETADDEGKFLSALAARLAYVPLFEEVRLTFAPGDPLPLVHLVAARVADTLADFLGFLAGRDCTEIGISTARHEGSCKIWIRCPGKNLPETVGEAKWKSFARRFGMGGLEFLAQDGCLCLKAD